MLWIFERKEKWRGDLKARVLAILAAGDAEAILQCVELVSHREGEHRDAGGGRISSTSLRPPEPASSARAR